MKKRIAAGLSVLAAGILCLLLLLCARTDRIRVGGSVMTRKFILSDRGQTVQYELPNGDLFHQQTCREANSQSRLLAVEHCTVRYVPEGESAWTVVQDPEELSLTGTVFLESPGLNLFLAQPQTYVPMEHDCLRYLPELDGTVTLQRSPEGWMLTVSVPALPEEAFSVWYALYCREPLADWTARQQEIWLGYRLTETYRWCGDGMYQPSPETYDPAGAHVYFRNPASYIPAKFVSGESSRAADDLGTVMLDIVRRELGKDGYLPVSAQSQWLQTDYGIGHGYYDTRWATDFALALLDANDRFHIPAFRRTARRYADFLQSHLLENGFILPDGTLPLPPDYGWHGSHKMPHVSLNHALAEALFLYRVGCDPAAQELVAALAETDWLLPDGNLRYGLLPDGGTIGTDYPCLTYNDLYKLRDYLQSREMEFPRALQTLMDSKLLWMQKNGVGGYMGQGQDF